MKIFLVFLDAPFYNGFKESEVIIVSDFASMLKYFREREHLSQRELASRLNMSPSAIGMYESGKRQPRFEDEETIADFFNVDINTLRGRRIPEEPTLDARSKRFIELFENVPQEIQDAVETLLKSAQPKS